MKKYKEGEIEYENITRIDISGMVFLWTLKSSEICLFGTKGKMTQFKINNSVESLIFAERNKHSQKPLEYKKRIVEMFGDQPTIELFARDCYEKWECLGDGLNGEDIRISLSKMIKND